MIKLYFDIETLPAEKEKHDILEEIRQKRLEDGKKTEDFETLLSSTSFDGGFGRIACISYAINDGEVKTLSGDERKILQDFWNIAKDVFLFVGYNIFDFDLRFIYQRSIVLGVRPTKDLSFARYRNSPIFDVMCEWVKWNLQNKVSLNHLAKALGFPTSKGGDVEGKNVAQAFEDGRIQEICEYCEKDVELTRKIYKKMIFEDQDSEKDPSLPF